MRAMDTTLRAGKMWLSAAALMAAFAGCSDAVGSEPELDAAFAVAGQLDMSGSWKFNAEASERPPRPAGDRGGVEGTPRHRRFGPHGPRGPAGSALRITQTDSTITFAHGTGRAHTIFTDGRTVEREARHGGRLQLQAFWSDDGLVVQRTGERGTMRRTYSLSAGGEQLYVQIHLERDGLTEPVEFRHVFDRVTE